MRCVHAEHAAQVAQEALRGEHPGGCHALPAGDEGVCRVRGRGVRFRIHGVRHMGPGRAIQAFGAQFDQVAWGAHCGGAGSGRMMGMASVDMRRIGFGGRRRTRQRRRTPAAARFPKTRVAALPDRARRGAPAVGHWRRRHDFGHTRYLSFAGARCMSFASPLLITFAAYLALMVGLGFVAWRRTRTFDDYILGGRSLGSYVTALAAGASDMSGWLMMGLPGALYLTGASEVWIAVGLVLGAWANWKYVAGPLRVYTERTRNALTLPDYFTHRFEDNSRVLRILSALVILVFFAIYCA